MKEAFLSFATRGVMTKEDLALVLQVKPDWVRRHSKAPHGFIPRIPHLRQLRFDPLKMIDIFCVEPSAEKLKRSVKIEKRKHSGTCKGGFAKCV